MQTYKSFIHPGLEYSCILFAHAEDYLLKKIQSIKTEAIKIAYDLAPWTSNYWCYSQITFTPILQRMKDLAKSFLEKNSSDPLIKSIIDKSKPSMLGKHSPVFKVLNHYHQFTKTLKQWTRGTSMQDSVTTSIIWRLMYNINNLIMYNILVLCAHTKHCSVGLNWTNPKKIT